MMVAYAVDEQRQVKQKKTTTQALREESRAVVPKHTEICCVIQC